MHGFQQELAVSTPYGVYSFVYTVEQRFQLYYRGSSTEVEPISGGKDPYINFAPFPVSFMKAEEPQTRALTNLQLFYLP